MILIALALAAAAAPCKATDTHLPRDLSGWTRAGKTLDTGHTVTLTGRAGTGETNVTIRKAGSFGIAVDSNAWVDIYRGRGKALTMASESRGPACSTIRKIVRYNLSPGTYRVTVTNMTAGHAKLMLVHSEARTSHEVFRRYRRHR
jgi:hypothetical protein